MAIYQQKTQSLWQKHFILPEFPKLTEPIQTDICVVGGGVAGMLVAYELVKQGREVVVLERGPLHKNETGFTTAHLSDAIDDGFAHIKSIHGIDKLRLFYQSHKMAIDIIEKIVRDEGIECDFQRVDGFLFLSSDKSAEYLAQEYETALEAGAEDIKLATDFPEAFFNMGTAIRFSNQAQLHPLKFIQGLTQAVLRGGGKIYTHSNVEDVHEGDEVFVTVGGNRVSCNSIVLATNGPTTTNSLYLKQAAYRTYSVAVKIRKDSVKPALYWDTSDSYHYLRVASSSDPNSDVLIIGGEDHRVGEGHPEKALENLLSWIQTRLSLPHPEVEAFWSGQLLEPVDGLAFIGRSPGKKNIYIITGDSGHGFTHSAIASKLINNLIQGEHSELAKLYDPHRFAIKALKDYASENLNTVQQYADWIMPHESITHLANDEGCVVNHGLQRIAVYKDNEGHLHKMSAVCPHMGGIVKWNSLEKTWDCPCHGSRFNCFGGSLHSPTTLDLRSLEPKNPEAPGNSPNYQEPR
ncbi:FAD-dependent oxidoreductase [Bdellovibrio sp. HCB209]|uniref:FAD-dependent oxidoreductase n=1 Tax=Bdellovibrio sp. HCB209 TaxID=3394354 RepID=UPI0039B552C9